MHAPPMQDSGRTKPNKNIALNKVLGLHAIGTGLSVKSWGG